MAIDAHEARERAAYWRAGLVTSAVINVNRKKGSRAAKPEDFVPKKRRSAPQSPRHMANALKALTLAMGGIVRDRCGNPP